MKANELMIGDWVMQDDNLQQNRVCQITGIYNNVVVDVTDERVPLHESHIKPIPLTPEILEKNGVYLFSRDIKYITYYNNELQISVSYVKDTKEWMVFLGASGSVKKKFVEVSCVKYVHELQHALKLCGIEKTIEL